MWKINCKNEKKNALHDGLRKRKPAHLCNNKQTSCLSKEKQRFFELMKDCSQFMNDAKPPRRRDDAGGNFKIVSEVQPIKGHKF